MSPSYDNLRQDFIFNRDHPEYRQAYAEESLDLSVGTQIKVLREQREWRQEDLARQAEIRQPMVSRYENVNYSNWSINTLKKLARAFDVWLDVRFRSYGELVTTTEEFSRESLQVPKFADDPFFKRSHRVNRRRSLRPRIRTTVRVPQIIDFKTRQYVSVESQSGPSQLALLWDAPATSQPGSELANLAPARTGNKGTSVLDDSLRLAAGAERRLYGTL